MRKFSIVNVVGARPNFMKIAPLLREQKKYSDIINPILLHTGQHYDYKMSQKIFGDLELPKPDVYLNVGSGTHAEQTAKIMVPFEKYIMENSPDLVLVVGDVNSTLACAVVASKLHIPIAHVEAGLRSFDREMPEELNRVVTDQLSDMLFTTEPSATENLLNEGRPIDKIFFTGNVMIDSLVNALDKVDDRILNEYNLIPGEYIAVTLHRASNVDDFETLKGIIDALLEVASKIKVVFPVHPRTKNNFEKFDLTKLVESMPGKFITTDPVGYLDFVALQKNSRMVLTDSGGIQEESCFLKVPCLTLRNNTERPVTVDCGSNKILGTDPGIVSGNAFELLDNPPESIKTPEKWDGKASERIIREIINLNKLDTNIPNPTAISPQR